MTKLPYIPAQDGPPKMTQYGKQQETPSYNFRYINNQNLLDNLSKKDEKDPFLEGFNQDREDENRWKSMLDTVKRGAQTTPTQYSNKSDANISQEVEQTLQERLVEYGDDVQNIAEDMLRIAKDLPPHAYAAILTTMVSPPGSLPRIIAGRVLEDEVKKIHYSRNQYNINLPETEKDVDEWEWEQEVANCHQFTAPDGQRYIKYVSPDGKREVIFDSEWNVITADEDEGTYNYADSDLRLAHGVVDVLPWIVYGNTPEDSTKWYERVKGLFNFEQ